MSTYSRARATAVDAVRTVADKVLARQIHQQREDTRQLREEVRQLREDMTVAQQEETRVLSDLVREEIQRIRHLIEDVEHRDRRDVMVAKERATTLEAAMFVVSDMRGATPLPSPHDTLRHSLSLAPQGGMALEFGVWTGGTLRLITEARDGHEVYGFDTFSGLPQEWIPGFPAGAFALDGLPDVPGAELVKGLFSDTLPGFLDDHPGPVDFLHVDCDLYSSTRTVLQLAGPRLHEGSVVHFDEYYNYVGWREHEIKAWEEYVQETGVEYEYVAFCFQHQQASVRITKV